MACLQQQVQLQRPHRQGQASSIHRSINHRHLQRPQLRYSIVPRAGAAEWDEPVDEATMRDASVGVVFSQQQADVSDKIEFPCTVPLLPFTVEEVLLPGSVKTLHLFEARYLSLLDTVLAQPGKNKVFGHVIVEQQGEAFGETAAAFPGAYKGDGFVFLMATLVRVVEVKKVSVGALVRIQAESRAEVTEVTQLLPYFEGRMVPLCDQPLQDKQQVRCQVEQLAQTVRDLQNLTQRFKSKQSASLQQAAYWADRDVLISAVQPPPSNPQQQQQEGAAGSLQSSLQDSKDTGSTDSSSSSSNTAAEIGQLLGADAEQQLGAEHQQDVAERAVRLSFAALQGVPQESPKDEMKLLRCCVRAMKTTDTVERLSAVQEHMQNSLNTLAAKCALKALNLG